jgi:gas vesicle protein
MGKLYRKMPLELSFRKGGNTMLRIRDFAAGVVVGALAGAGTMLFFAPRSGKRMRAKLQHQVEDLREQLAEELEDREEEVLAQAHRVAAGARGTAQELRRRGQGMLER